LFVQKNATIIYLLEKDGIMIMYNRNREEFTEPIFVKGKLSKYDVDQITKAIDQFQNLKLSSEMKIASLQVSLMRVVREKGNSPETSTLVWGIKEESDFIKGFEAQILRYKELLGINPSEA
jgi:hypothetical protein